MVRMLTSDLSKSLCLQMLLVKKTNLIFLPPSFNDISGCVSKGMLLLEP